MPLDITALAYKGDSGSLVINESGGVINVLDDILPKKHVE